MDQYDKIFTENDPPHLWNNGPYSQCTMNGRCQILVLMILTNLSTFHHLQQGQREILWPITTTVLSLHSIVTMIWGLLITVPNVGTVHGGMLDATRAIWMVDTSPISKVLREWYGSTGRASSTLDWRRRKWNFVPSPSHLDSDLSTTHVRQQNKGGNYGHVGKTTVVIKVQ